MFPNVTQKVVSHISFYIRVRFFKIALTVANNLGYFVRNFVTERFKKSPNLFTLLKAVVVS